MAKVTGLLCVMLVLAAAASAAPVTEETSSPNPTAINELIEGADPVENDITAPKTEIPVDEDKIIKELMDESATVGEVIPLEDDSPKNISKPDETPANPEIVKQEEGEPNGTVEKSPPEIESTKNVENAEDGGLVPVDEVIPPPKVAFVLGEYANPENSQDESSIQLVQGETQDGTPVISELGNEESFTDEVVDESMIPISEPALHDYPPETIFAEAEFHPDEEASMPDVPVGINADTDYDAPLDDLMPTNAEGPADGNTGFVPDYDYPVHSSFVGPLHNPDDFAPGYFDDSLNYETRSGFFMPGPVMNVDLPSMDYPEMNKQSNHQEMEEIRPQFDHITAGLEENYHPGPIPGFIPNTEEEQGGPEANYPVYKDQPIVAAAMLNSNIPAVESTHAVDTPVPERVQMEESPESPEMNEPTAMDNGIDTVDLTTLNINTIDFTTPANQDIDFVNPEEPITNDKKPDIVIELSLNRQEAAVNGRPFEMSQASNILNFIEDLITRMSHKPMMPDMTEHINEESEYPIPDMPMQNDFTYRFMNPNPYNRLAPREEVNYYGNYNYPSGNEFEYNPFFPLKPYFNQWTSPRFDNLHNNIYYGRFGFDSPPRSRRFAYNPFWN